MPKTRKIAFKERKRIKTMQNKNNLESALIKELYNITVQEKVLINTALKPDSEFISSLTKKVPDKVGLTLLKAFNKAFEIVFDKGTGIIEKTYDKTELLNDYKVHEYAVNLKGTRKELRKIHKLTEQTNLCSMAVTTAEGLGLGVLGIGIPDIVLFTAVLLRSAFETASTYGYDYNNPHERMLILKMMEASCTKGEAFVRINKEIDDYMMCNTEPSDNEIKEQLKRTSDVFAMEMLVCKFIQGIPIAGVIGGLSNPVYYKRITKYIRLKYYKRYLLNIDKDL